MHSREKCPMASKFGVIVQMVHVLASARRANCCDRRMLNPMGYAYYFHPVNNRDIKALIPVLVSHHPEPCCQSVLALTHATTYGDDTSFNE